MVHSWFSKLGKTYAAYKTDLYSLAQRSHKSHNSIYEEVHMAAILKMVAILDSQNIKINSTGKTTDALTLK